MTQEAAPQATKASGSAKASGRRPQRPQESISRPYFSQKIVLGSHQAQQVFKRSFDTANKAFTDVGIVLRIVGTEQDAAEAEQMVDEMLTKLAEDIRAEKVRMEKLCEENGITAGSPNFTDPLSAEVQIFSPRAGRYLGVIREMDMVIAHMTLLWLSGALADAQYTNGAYMLQRRVLKVAARIKNIADRARQATQRKKREVTSDPQTKGQSVIGEKEAQNLDGQDKVNGEVAEAATADAAV